MTATSHNLVLTFDDGPGPSTERLLEVLEVHEARATFFVLGRNLAGESLNGDRERAIGLLRRAVRAGHLLGNHTMSHAAELPVEELLREVAACDAELREVHVGAERTPPAAFPVRLPFGPYRRGGAACLEALEQLGRPHCHWTGDPQDWRAERTARQIADAMLRHAEQCWSAGATPILLLHDSGEGGACGGVARESTVDAVDELCRRLAYASVQYQTVLECEPSILRFQFRHRGQPQRPMRMSPNEEVLDDT